MDVSKGRFVREDDVFSWLVSEWFFVFFPFGVWIGALCIIIKRMIIMMMMTSGRY